MDYQNYITDNIYGNYSVLFKNIHHLKSKEIMDIFSEFGKVVDIKMCGNEYSYYFIRYKQLIQAENAVLGLIDHPKIKLLIPNSRSTNPKGSTLANSNFSTDRNKINFNNKYRNEVTENNCSKKHNDIKNNVSIPTLPVSVNHKITFENIPNLIVQRKSDINEHNVKLKNAEEIIVGNIHPNFNAAYILHLFDNFEPLAISQINIIPATNIRYCHVYFKSIEDSMIVEKTFDKMTLLGRNLIVLSLSSLLQEAII